MKVLVVLGCVGSAVASFRRAAMSSGESEKEECFALNAAMSIYKSENLCAPDPHVSFNISNFNHTEYEHTEWEWPFNGSTEVDRVWWIKAPLDQCWFVFKGADGYRDVASMVNESLTDKWGLRVHQGALKELEGLLEVMKGDFEAIKGCKKVIAAGHSMGGSLAQLFALALNSGEKPFANFTVDVLYTFGALSVAKRPKNEEAYDGCFQGGQYYYAELNSSTNTIVTDQASINSYDPVRSNKYFVFPNGTKKEYPCGTPLPNSESLFLDKGCKLELPTTKACGPWCKLHMNYMEHLGCANPCGPSRRS